MEGQISAYRIKLDAWARRDGTEWLAWCPLIDVMTQARTRKEAFVSLKEAVELWFESCIDRGVLEDALEDAGFKLVHLSDAELIHESNFIQITQLTSASQVPEPKFSLGHDRRSDYIEGTLPSGSVGHGPDKNAYARV